MVALRSRKSREALVPTATQDMELGRRHLASGLGTVAGQLWPRQQEAGWRQRARLGGNQGLNNSVTRCEERKTSCILQHVI